MKRMTRVIPLVLAAAWTMPAWADKDIPTEGLFPAPGAADVCPDTPLRITFDASVTLGKGRVQITDTATNAAVATIDVGIEKVTKTLGTIPNFNTRPALADGKTLYLFPLQPLAYGHTYAVTVDAGVAAVGGENSAALTDSGKWKFTTKKAPPAEGSTKLTVAADGGGDFATLQGALDFVPARNTNPTTITLKKGTYHEIVAVTDKHNLTILGEDRKGTVLSFPNNNNFNNPGSPYRRGLFIAHRCNDLTLANMTFHNTTPRGGSQAEAVILNGTPTARAVLTQLDLVSFQDTLQINGQAYIQDCYIEGDVDFLWGSGPCYFKNVECKTTRSKAYFTQIRNPATNHGYVFNGCTFTGAEGVTGNVFSRIDPSRFPASEVVLLDCIVSDAVGPVAWQLDRVENQLAVTPEKYPQLHFWEFNSRTPAGQPVDVSQRHPVSRQLKATEDAELVANYRNPTWVLENDWTPKLPDLPGK
jgi:hypothetical protein